MRIRLFDVGAWHDWPEYVQLMPQAERARIGKFRHDVDAKLTLAGHLMARRWLADAIPAASVEILRTEFNRPYCPQLSPRDCWNISHHGSVVVFCGDTLLQQVGIDVVQLTRGSRDWNSLHSVLTAGEQAKLRQMPNGDQHDEFMRIWARKEAYLKCHGVGLSREPCVVDTLQGFADGTRTLECQVDAEYFLAVAYMSETS